MPELPDVTVYIERLEALLVGKRVEAVRCPSAFVVRTYEPPLSALVGCAVVGFRRVGKRIVFEFEGDLLLVVHLMIAGRLRFVERGPLPRKLALAALDFSHGTLMLTEAGTKKRASLHLVRGESSLAAFDRGGAEPLEVDEAAFSAVLRRENRTLKRALTDPRLFSGIGNAYSDEILFHARLSPVKRTAQLSSEEISRLFGATRETLSLWTDRLRAEAGAGFPVKVTAFRPDMAVHGRYKLPCPVCATAVQRIRYAENEVNYCPRCQTAGKLLADRSLSLLLKHDWPRNIDELEEKQERGAEPENSRPPKAPRSAAVRKAAAAPKTAAAPGTAAARKASVASGRAAVSTTEVSAQQKAPRGRKRPGASRG